MAVFLVMQMADAAPAAPISRFIGDAARMAGEFWFSRMCGSGRVILGEMVQVGWSMVTESRASRPSCAGRPRRRGRSGSARW